MQRFSIGLVPLLVTSSILAGDWPGFRGPNGNGICAEKLILLDKPRPVWTRNVGSGNASLIVAKGRIYTVGFQKDRGSVVLSCLDAKTGRIVWDRKINSGGSDSSPLVADGKLYVLCHLGKPKLLCLQTSDGKDVWERELPSPTGGDRHYGHAGSPMRRNDLIVVNVGAGAAVNRKTGKIVWQHDGLPGLATPVSFREGKTDGVLIFGGQELFARDIRTGTLHWSIPWKTNLAVNAGDPIYHAGKVFISTDYGKHAALFDVRGGKPKQLWREQGSSYDSGILWKDHIYTATKSGFACLDLKTGKRAWLQRYGSGSVILSDDKLILFAGQGYLQIAPVSSREFRPVVQAQIHEGTTRTPPSLSNGRLYVRNEKGDVACVQIARGQ